MVTCGEEEERDEDVRGWTKPTMGKTGEKKTLILK